MAKKQVPLGVGGIRVPIGTHIAAFYRDDEERCSLVVPFIKTGLEQGARCISIVHGETRDALLGALSAVDVQAAVASGKLRIFTTAETYLSDGYFSPQKMVSLVETLMREAVEEGIEQIRLAGDMTWALDGRPGTERLMEYEARLDKVLVGYPHISLCQYDITKFKGDMVVDALRTHLYCILGGVMIRNHFYMGPDRFLKEFEERASDRAAVAATEGQS